MKVKPFLIGATVMVVTIALWVSGCGGASQPVAPPVAPSDATPGATPTPVALTITPETDTLGPHGTRKFVSGGDVLWSVLEGATGGTITDAGLYTAPEQPGTYHVVASSVADRSKAVTAAVQVVKSGFTVAGAIQKSRLGHNATMLPNGKVLIAGGGWGNSVWDGLSSVPESELFDPSTGTSTISGTTSRTFATATLLSNGHVLLTGGEYGDPSTWKIVDTAATYDSVAGQFRQVGNMGATREYHAATLLNDGRVLVTGGYDFFWSSVSSAEIYNPASETFAFTGSMASRRDSHTSTLLANGKVLVAGGFDSSSTGGTASAELYDPVTGVFVPTGNMSEPRARHTATLLPDGNVLMTGGGALKGGTAELYDVSTGTFTPVGQMKFPRWAQHTATLLPNGTVLIAGGVSHYSDKFRATYTAEIYDPSTSSFLPAGGLAEPRMGHTATALADGSVLLLGGSSTAEGQGFVPVKSAEIYR